MDKPLTENEKAQWERWLGDVEKLENLPSGIAEVWDIQLHLFSDISRHGIQVLLICVRGKSLDRYVAHL